jgi:hypothetical protein
MVRFTSQTITLLISLDVDDRFHFFVVWKRLVAIRCKNSKGLQLRLDTNAVGNNNNNYRRAVRFLDALLV